MPTTTLLFVGAVFQTPILRGNTTYYVVNDNGTCQSGTSVTVTVTPKPTTPTINSNTPVCEEGDIILTATTVAGAGVQYNWYGIDGGLLGTSTVPTYTIHNATPANSGVYSVTASIGDCVIGSFYNNSGCKTYTSSTYFTRRDL